MLVVTFRMAYGMFTVPPAQAMGTAVGKPADLVKSGDKLPLRAVAEAVQAGTSKDESAPPRSHKATQPRKGHRRHKPSR